MSLALIAEALRSLIEADAGGADSAAVAEGADSRNAAFASRDGASFFTRALLRADFGATTGEDKGALKLGAGMSEKRKTLPGPLEDIGTSPLGSRDGVTGASAMVVGTREGTGATGSGIAADTIGVGKAGASLQERVVSLREWGRESGQLSFWRAGRQAK